MSNALVVDNHPGIRATAFAALVDAMGFEEVCVTAAAVEALQELHK